MSLHVSRYMLAEQGRAVHMAIPEEGTTLKQIQEPQYWAHVAADLRVHDRIEVAVEGGELWCELLVIAKGNNWVKTAVINRLEEKIDEQPEDNKDFKVQHRGPRKWSVVRIEDSAIIAEDIGTKLEAEQHKLDHIKALAA